jgi:hypothetical protein
MGFAVILARLLQQIISKMKLFTRMRPVPEIVQAKTCMPEIVHARNHAKTTHVKIA